ncbi:hypothetical protein DVJ78_08960 [Humibacter sp. BT305]|nr:hypothetical protein DVJ78_08960 [Humibacter sp. BT305]
MRMARSLVVMLVVASGYAVAGVSIGELAVSGGSAPALALAAAAVLAGAALLVAVRVVARSGDRPMTAPGAVARRAPVEPRISASASRPHVLPSPRAPAGVSPATA